MQPPKTGCIFKISIKITSIKIKKKKTIATRNKRNNT